MVELGALGEHKSALPLSLSLFVCSSASGDIFLITCGARVRLRSAAGAAYPSTAAAAAASLCLFNNNSNGRAHKCSEMLIYSARKSLELATGRRAHSTCWPTRARVYKSSKSATAAAGGQRVCTRLHTRKPLDSWPPTGHKHKLFTCIAAPSD